MADILKLMAIKLGLNNEINVLRKASEYERLLKIKTRGSIVISDYAKAIICLDLATDALGLPFDTELGLRLSAVKKSAYINSKHNIKKFLKLEDVISINSVCVQLGCTNVCDAANSILEYFKKTDIKNSDTDHPQYICMSVFQACRMEKIKIAKSKFMTHSHLKPSQWNDLETNWTKMVDEMVKSGKMSIKNVKRTKKNQNVAQMISENVQDAGKESHNTNVKANEETECVEDYETWKKRILEEAYKELSLETEAVHHTIINLKKGTSVINREKGIKLILN